MHLFWYNQAHVIAVKEKNMQLWENMQQHFDLTPTVMD